MSPPDPISHPSPEMDYSLTPSVSDQVAGEVCQLIRFCQKHLDHLTLALQTSPDFKLGFMDSRKEAKDGTKTVFGGTNHHQAA